MKITPKYLIFTAALLAFALTSKAGEDAGYSMTTTPPDVSAVPEDAETTDSGLASRVIKAGSGSESPAAADIVTVHYSGWTTDGELFDSSVRRGQPMSFPLNGVIPGWTEGLQLMVVGETRRFWIPADLAYGENPGGGRPGGMLVFDVELIDIEKAPEPPKVPEDVAAIPEDAEVTKSGLASRLLKAGDGEKKPSSQSVVTVHYSGWMTDGKLFSSTVVRGQPVTFELGGVMPGWTEGLQLMVEGEKRRFWIPADLAPGEIPGGLLVFDIELVKIVR
jgi:FKBP-type peptidyl-prolyl cis-trans isomerase